MRRDYAASGDPERVVTWIEEGRSLHMEDPIEANDLIRLCCYFRNGFREGTVAKKAVQAPAAAAQAK